MNDYSLFRKLVGTSHTIVVVYVDDILLAGDDESKISSLKLFLDDKFRIKDLGLIHYFLGLEIIHTSTRFLVSQHKFALDLLSEFHYTNVNPVVSPLDPHVKLSSDSGYLLPDPSMYIKFGGKRNFLQHTRPDLSFTVQHLRQFMASPRTTYLTAAHHVLEYLAGTPRLGLLLNNSSDFSLQGYCDSDWASCVATRRSVSGFVLFLGRCHISWKSKKPPTIALSTAEAEYNSLRLVVAEITWLVRLFAELGVHDLTPVHVFCECHAAVHIAKNP
ncbi:uncharacterized mitochondrial protein AtMg00810-like, partial [Capsicum annuum]|uniref:uncharacterized mitochondrial protein AtMg00810-like n=1 Tax=Capsicum annuum TaxID=4072 RepID=UPI001FB16150